MWRTLRSGYSPGSCQFAFPLEAAPVAVIRAGAGAEGTHVAAERRRDHPPASGASAMTPAARAYVAAVLRLLAEAVIEPKLWPVFVQVLRLVPPTLVELLRS